jgi:hypothetical protein
MKSITFYWWALVTGIIVLLCALGSVTQHNPLTLFKSLIILIGFIIITVNFNKGYDDDLTDDLPAPSHVVHYSIKLYASTGVQRHLVERFDNLSADQLARYGLARIQTHVSTADHTAQITPTFDLRWWNLTKRRERSIIPSPTIDRSLLPRIEGLLC